MKIRVVNPSTPARRHRRRTRKNPGGVKGGVFIVARSTKRRRSRRQNSHRRARRHNPFGFGGRVRHHRRRRRHNPIGGMGFRDLGGQLLWGTAGGVASLTVPGLVASSYNSGFTGYLLNGATAWVGSMLISKMAGPKAGSDFFVGGLVATGLRIFNNYFGSSFPVGLGGMGFYVQNSFPLPTAGTGPLLLNQGYEASTPMPSIAAAAPAAAAAAAAGMATATGSDEPARWGKWAA